MFYEFSCTPDLASVDDPRNPNPTVSEARFVSECMGHPPKPLNLSSSRRPSLERIWEYSGFCSFRPFRAFLYLSSRAPGDATRMHIDLKTAIQVSALMRKNDEGAHFWSVSFLCSFPHRLHSLQRGGRTQKDSMQYTLATEKWLRRTTPFLRILWTWHAA